MDEPDLTTWAWHRATGAAAAVLVATTIGLLFGPGGALAAFAGAAGVVYVVGPALAIVERVALRHGEVTLGRLRRTWLVSTSATVALIGTALGAQGLVLVALPIALVAAWSAVAIGLRVPPRLGRPLAIVVPAIASSGAGIAAVDVGLVEAVLILAVLVVVPTAAPLLAGAAPATPLVLLAGGAPATAGLLLRPDDGALAGVLTLPWVAVTGIGALLALGRWRDRGWRSSDLVAVLACGYLAVGALWLLADRTGTEPAGFGPPFTALTAVHFTYAGFVALTLADRVRTRRPDDRAATVAVVATAGAPPLVALGFVALGALQILGAVLLTVGTYALAWVTLRHVVPVVRRTAAWTLALSALSVPVPMLLAVQWAVGTNLGTPALSIPAMTATHGLANALGFSLFGVLGWRLVARDEPTPGVDEGP